MMVENDTMKVSHSRSPTTSFTGRLNSNEKPKSPCTMPNTQSAYCSHIGLSKPYCSRRKAILSALTFSPWACSSAT